MVVESHENHAEQSDKADQRAERHEKLAESFTFALARETGQSVRESGHIRGGIKREIRIFPRLRQTKICLRRVTYCKSRMVNGYLYSSPLLVLTAPIIMSTTQATQMAAANR